MKYHIQKYRHDVTTNVVGDCYRTALACILDKDIEEVPHVSQVDYNNAKAFKEHFNTYLATLKLKEIDIPYNGDTTTLETVLQQMSFLNPNTLYMISGRSSVENHVVIAYHDKIICDTATGEEHTLIGPTLQGLYWVTILTPLIKL